MITMIAKHNLSRSKIKAFYTAEEVASAADSKARQIIKECKFTDWLASFIEYLNDNAFGDLKVWLQIEEDTTAITTCHNSIYKRLLNRIAVPPEIDFVDTIQAA